MDDQKELIDKAIQKLQSQSSFERYEACTLLNKAPKLTPEAVNALRNALNDWDEDIRGYVKRILTKHNIDIFTQSKADNITAARLNNSFTLNPHSKTVQDQSTLITLPVSVIYPFTAEHLFSLEKRIIALETQMQQAFMENKRLGKMCEDFRTKIPVTNLLSDNYITRAFAVWGHYFVSQLILSIPIILIYILFFSMLLANQ